MLHLTILKFNKCRGRLLGETCLGQIGHVYFNFKDLTDKVPNYGEGSSVPLKYTIAIYTSTPQKALGMTMWL